MLDLKVLLADASEVLNASVELTIHVKQAEFVILGARTQCTVENLEDKLVRAVHDKLGPEGSWFQSRYPITIKGVKLPVSFKMGDEGWYEVIDYVGAFLCHVANEDIAKVIVDSINKEATK